MSYAQVVVGLPVEGPFDYAVPVNFKDKIAVGSRVGVSFGPKNLVGYVVKLTRTTRLKKTKEITELLDEYPVLDRTILELARELAVYNFCSWGEAIETALPEPLRSGRRFTKLAAPSAESNELSVEPGEIILLHDIGGRARWDVYLQEIRNTLDCKRSALLICPDVTEVFQAKDTFKAKLGIEPVVLYRKQPRELDEWLKVRESRAQLVIGARSAVFAPLTDLGLVIIDEEENSVYKQDQVPHYHARHAGILRSAISGAKLILGSAAPSLEAMQLVRQGKARCIQLPKAGAFPEVKLIDRRHLPYQDRKARVILPRLLSDSIFSVLTNKGKTLLFINRKGFATFAVCLSCGAALKCPRCSVNLAYHFESKSLACHRCNFRMEIPDLCPSCNAGYIKYSGTGTEKIESEVARIFPAARIKIIETEADLSLSDADIFVSTSFITKSTGLSFDLIGVLDIDNMLNRVDFRAAEKAFAVLSALAGFTDKQVLIPTSFPSHHVFLSLMKKDPGLFYEEEFKERKQLGYPPYKHIAAVKLRAKYEEKVERSARALFEKFNGSDKSKGVEVVSVSPAQPAKLRGNYYWQILLKSAQPEDITGFLKNNLKNFLHSGIIVTVDMDPL